MLLNRPFPCTLTQKLTSLRPSIPESGMSEAASVVEVARGLERTSSRLAARMMSEVADVRDVRLWTWSRLSKYI